MASSPTHAMRKRDEGGLASAVQASTGQGRVGLAGGLAGGRYVCALPRQSVRSRAREAHWVCRQQAGRCREGTTKGAPLTCLVAFQRLASEPRMRTRMGTSASTVYFVAHSRLGAFTWCQPVRPRQRVLTCCIVPARPCAGGVTAYGPPRLEPCCGRGKWCLATHGAGWSTGCGLLSTRQRKCLRADMPNRHPCRLPCPTLRAPALTIPTAGAAAREGDAAC